MGVDEWVRGQLATRFEVLLPHLNERQQRMALACEARLLGHGGVAAVADAARVSPTTVRRGGGGVDGGEEPLPARGGERVHPPHGARGRGRAGRRRGAAAGRASEASRRRT